MRATSQRAERLLDLLNILLSDVRYGLGAYLGVYLLSEHGWSEAAIGVAITIGGLAGLASATPMGALVDRVSDKRWLIAGAALVVTASCLLIPIVPTFWPVVAAGVVGSVAGTVFAPSILSMSLGMVGHGRFPARAGRNEAMFHAGNAACNALVLAAAFVWGSAVVFWVLAGTALGSVFAALAIPREAVDPELARDAPATLRRSGSKWPVLLANPPLLIFAACGALFHLANGAMLGLVGQKLAHVAPGYGIALTAACAIMAQSVMVPVALYAGSRTNTIGRKPLLVAAFVALAMRGLFCALSDQPASYVLVQILDGIGAGLTGALIPVVIADLTRGSGHFGLAQAGIGTLQGVGGALSSTLAGLIVSNAGYGPAFLTLTVIAGAGLLVFMAVMPETAHFEPDRAAARA